MERSDDRAIDLVLRLTRALHTFGCPAHRLEQAMQRVAASALVAGLLTANLLLPSRRPL